jgi:hypothetical protein
LITLVTALPQIAGSVFVMNIDHVYRPGVAERIRAQAGEHVTAFVDFDRTLAADDMKVTLDDAKHVVKISRRAGAAAPRGRSLTGRDRRHQRDRLVRARYARGRREGAPRAREAVVDQLR